MATLARDVHRDDRIDAFLAYLHAEWEAVPELAEEWAEWSEMDRLDFTLDWPIREDRLAQLDALARDGQLTATQQTRHQQMQDLVARHRPLLDQLFQAAGLPSSAAESAQPPSRA